MSIETIKIFFYQNVYRILKRIPGLNNKFVKIISGPLKGSAFLVNVDSYYLAGTFEEESLNFFIENVNSSDIFYDIGANVGYYSLIFSKKCKEVFAFEPLPQNIDKLKKNIAKNNIENVKLFEVAVSNKCGDIQFSNSLSNVSNTYKTNSDLLKDLNTITVKTTTIDKLIEDNIILPPNVIKIDVEGAELDVLEGAKNTLIKYKPFIVFGTHDIHLPGIKEECLNFFKQIGYTVKPMIGEIFKPGLEDFYAYKE